MRKIKELERVRRGEEGKRNRIIEPYVPGSEQCRMNHGEHDRIRAHT